MLSSKNLIFFVIIRKFKQILHRTSDVLVYQLRPTYYKVSLFSQDPYAECFPRPPLQVCFIKTRIKQNRYVVSLKQGFRIFSNIKVWFILSESDV